jgi:hypothetical protein
MVQEIAPVQYNFKILDFTLICKEISRVAINDLYSYGLLEKPKFTRNVKRLLLHHTIHQICEYFLNRHKRSATFIYFAKLTYNTELHEIYGESTINEWLYNTILKIKNILPIRILIGHLPFTTIKFQIDENSGDGVEFLQMVRTYANWHNTDKYTFSRVKQYATRHELTFLSQDYFSRLKTKNLLFA